jgi:hypothetical protein
MAESTHALALATSHCPYEVNDFSAVAWQPAEAKRLKSLEKEQKTRETRMIHDGLDAALLDIATFYRDLMMVQTGIPDTLFNKVIEAEINAVAAKTKP